MFGIFRQRKRRQRNGVKRTMVVYFDDTNIFKGEFEKSDARLKEFIAEAKEDGYVGYLSGSRRAMYPQQGTIAAYVFFRRKVSDSEILKRRGNGFLGARWHHI